MPKYLGSIKIEKESMSGLEVRIITKSSSRKEEVEEWTKLYPDSESLVIECDDITLEFFECFNDISSKSMTGEEKRKAEETYRKFWNDEER